VVVAGLTLAVALMVLGLGTGHRQYRTARRLREERFLPSDDRAYLRGQVVRRSLVAVVLVLIGGMIAGYYLSGMDARADRIADRKKNVIPADDPGRPADPNPADDADREFAKFLGAYWIGILALVFVVACLAVLDFWATRRYWMAQYRQIREDHETKLRRDLAVYRQQKDNARLGGRGRPRKADDDTDEAPPVE
jgi:hypothetical protein